MSTARQLPPDIEIARRADIQPIEQIAERLNIADDDLEHYGKYKAKVSLDLYHRLERRGRQTGAGDGHYAHARRRRQDHHQHRPVRRAEPHRQAGPRLPPRALAGALLRHEGRGGRRRLFPGHPHGGHQPPFHRRFPRRRAGPQPPGRHARQPHPPRQRPGHRSPPHRLEAGGGHERPGPAEHHRRPGGNQQLDAPRGRLRHHRGQRSDGLLLPLRIAGRIARAAGTDHRGLYPRPQADHGRRSEGPRRHDRAAERRHPAQPRADARRQPGLHPRRPLRQHRPRLQQRAGHQALHAALRLHRHRGRLRRRPGRREVHEHQVPQGRHSTPTRW